MTVLLATLRGLFIKILSSQKAMLTLAGLITAFLAKRGFHATDQEILLILGFFAPLVLGQGIADYGKGAAKVEAIANAQINQGTSSAEKIDAIKSV